MYINISTFDILFRNVENWKIKVKWYEIGLDLVTLLMLDTPSVISSCREIVKNMYKPTTSIYIQKWGVRLHDENATTQQQ